MPTHHKGARSESKSCAPLDGSIGAKSSAGWPDNVARVKPDPPSVLWRYQPPEAAREYHRVHAVHSVCSSLAPSTIEQRCYHDEIPMQIRCNADSRVGDGFQDSVSTAMKDRANAMDIR
jgi:hypothetical protein